MNIEGDAGADEDGVRVLHFFAGEQAQPFVEGKIEVSRPRLRQLHLFMPDAVGTGLAVAPVVEPGHRVGQDEDLFVHCGKPGLQGDGLARVLDVNLG